MWVILTPLNETGVEVTCRVRVNMDTIETYASIVSEKGERYTALGKAGTDFEIRVLETPEEIDYLVMANERQTDVRGFWEDHACSFFVSHYEAKDKVDMSDLRENVMDHLRARSPHKIYVPEGTEKK